MMNLAAMAAALIVGAPPAELAGTPNLTVFYYDVSGTTEQEIRGSINAQDLRGANDRVRVDALTTNVFAWYIQPRADGLCDAKDTHVSFSLMITLPRLATPEALTPAALRNWDRYMAALIRHEQGHVKNALEQAPKVVDAIWKARDCAAVDAAGDAALAVLAKQDLKYDARTRHGVSQGARYP